MVGNNAIGLKGAKLLLLIFAPLLEELKMSKLHNVSDQCNIRNVGIHQLAKSYWPNLRKIDMSTYFLNYLDDNNISEMAFPSFSLGTGKKLIIF